jgi:hypothetical protein
MRKSATAHLNELAASKLDHFDIFLSHSIRDSDLVEGARLELEDKGFTVYVDWIVDPQLNREAVNAETAAALRARMLQCDTLIYVHTDNSPKSKWMPWELGFFDGAKGGRVSVMPVLKTKGDTFRGQEYLGIYPAVDFTDDNEDQETIWIQRSSTEYASLKAWKKDPTSIRKRGQ